MSRGTSRSEEVLSLVGLARRSGGLAAGIGATRRTVRAGEARLVLTAKDASRTQLKKVLGPARQRRVPRRVVADRRRLGAALGASSVSAVAVTNPSLAERILERLPPHGEDGGV